MPELYAAACHLRTRIAAARRRFLRDGIYELRPSYESVQYRILYFFYGRDIVVLSHGVTKSQKVPSAEIERAIERKRLVMKDPSRYAGSLSPKEI